MNNKIRYLRRFSDFWLDAEKKVLWFNGEPIDLALKEIEILCILTENVNQIVTKEELLNQVWANSFVEESNLTQHIYRLRKMFKQLGKSEKLIQTIPRRGYRFTGEVHENRNNKLIIEKHSISRTLIEELDNSVEPNVKAIPAENLQINRKHLLFLITVCLVISALAFGFYFFNQNESPARTNNSIKSIAVLPLKSMGTEENERALGLGFADALITNLGKIEELKVLSVNTVGRYVNENEDPLEIGKNLGVDAIIDGTLQKVSGKLRVTLRLFRVTDGKQIWSNSFDKPETEIFDLQDLIASQTAQFLALRLKDKALHPTENQDAYQLYLQGVYLFRRRQPDLYKSTEFFQKAVELDPKFAKAQAMLAATYAMGVSMPEAETAINKALELNPNLAEAHAVHGFIKMFLDWNWLEAEKSLNRAIELDSNSVEAHHWRGIYLTIRGRFDEAKAEMNRALELDPTSANMISDLGQIYYFVNDYAKAEEFYLKANRMREDEFTKGRLIDLYERQGREKEAFETRLFYDCRFYQGEQKSRCLEEIKNAFEKGGSKAISVLNLNGCLKHLAYKKLAQNQIATNWYGATIEYLRLGKKDEAIESLNRALNSKTRFEIINFTFPFIRVDPTIDTLQNDARFQEILKKINL